MHFFCLGGVEAVSCTYTLSSSSPAPLLAYLHSLSLAAASSFGFLFLSYLLIVLFSPPAVFFVLKMNSLCHRPMEKWTLIAF